MDAILVEGTSSSKAGVENCLLPLGSQGLESHEQGGRALGLKRSLRLGENSGFSPEGDRRRSPAVLSRRGPLLGCRGFQDAGREVRE